MASNAPHPVLNIVGRPIGPGHPAYLVAEISANHHHSLEEAKALLVEAKKSGADAVKIQTYTADTMTIPCDAPPFQLPTGTPWAGRNLHDLYAEACTPWEWHEALFEFAAHIGLTLFSTPFDESAVDLLESLEAPAYKIASFELVHLPLIERVARTGKPLIISTGMGSLEEIGAAVATARAAGCRELALLKCTSAYPAPPAEVNLRRIPEMAGRFGVVAGLSDHTMGSAVAVASVPLGASLLEKHLTRSRARPGPDSSFSMEPEEFASMVRDVRTAEAALGRATYEITAREEASRVFRRSLFVVADIAQGDVLTTENIRIIRPGFGLLPKELPRVVGCRARRALARGTPLSWDDLET